jgi:hypothetical protein
MTFILKKVVITIVLFFGLKHVSYSQDMFACFENDVNKSLRVSVFFDKNNKAKFVKYDGQHETIPLFYSKIHKSKNEGGHPSVYWAETYIEKYRGKITGTYVFTNAGTRGLDVTYTRKRDNKEFYFSIIEGTQDQGNSTFRSTPCF